MGYLTLLTRQGAFGTYSCSCGAVKQIRVNSVRSGRTKSCGCLRKKMCALRGKANKKHGATGTFLYGVWRGMLTRCYNQATKYKYWNGTGVKVIWKSFEDFRCDMETSYKKHIKQHGRKKTSIDRIDPSGHYARENCRWATPQQQQTNRRKFKGRAICALCGGQAHAKKLCQKHYGEKNRALKREKDL